MENIFTGFHIIPFCNYNLLFTKNRKFDILILAVGHNQFINLDFKKLRKQNSIIYDLKSVLPKSSVDARL